MQAVFQLQEFRLTAGITTEDSATSAEDMAKAKTVRNLIMVSWAEVTLLRVANKGLSKNAQRSKSVITVFNEFSKSKDSEIKELQSVIHRGLFNWGETMK